MLSEIDRYETIIDGDVVEFIGEAVLIYENGYKVYPVREVYADGARLTFYVDHTQGVMAELYVPYRVVQGTVDTNVYVLAILRSTGEQGNGLSKHSDYPALNSQSSPYQRTAREVRACLISFQD
jgi:hypothetical protein